MFRVIKSHKLRSVVIAATAAVVLALAAGQTFASKYRSDEQPWAKNVRVKEMSPGHLGYFYFNRSQRV